MEWRAFIKESNRGTRVLLTDVQHDFHAWTVIPTSTFNSDSLPQIFVAIPQTVAGCIPHPRQSYQKAVSWRGGDEALQIFEWFAHWHSQCSAAPERQEEVYNYSERQITSHPRLENDGCLPRIGEVFFAITSERHVYQWVCRWHRKFDHTEKYRIEYEVQVPLTELISAYKKWDSIWTISVMFVRPAPRWRPVRRIAGA